MDSQKMDESMEDSIKDCQVCFQAFDGTERRPRCTPCGHTFCSKCFSDNLKKNLLLCPFCRKEYQAKAPKEFPVNYALENILQKLEGGFSSVTEISKASSDPPQGISKRMKLMRQELISSITSLGANTQQITSQLQHYKSLIQKWEDQHQESSRRFLDIAQQHEEMAKSIRKEFNKISEAIQEEEENKLKMNIAEERLLAAQVTQEIFPAFDETTKCYDVLEHWTEEVQRIFPNVELITEAIMLQELSVAMLQTHETFEEKAKKAKAEDASETDNQPEDLAASLPLEMTLSTHADKGNDTSPEETSSSTLPTVQEKLKRALEKASFHKQISQSGTDTQDKQVQTVLVVETQNEGIPLITVASLKNLMPLVKQQLESGQVYAVKMIEGKKHYAKISFQQNQLFLHVCTKNIPTHDASILKHDDVMSLINLSTRKAFIEFSHGERSLGRVIINLTPQSLRADNFAALCTGQMGPSHLNTKLLCSLDKGNCGECYEFILCDVHLGNAVVPGAGEECGGVFKKKKLASFVYGTHIGYEHASHFGIITKSDSKNSLNIVFGSVETGLDVVKYLVSCDPNIQEMKISDCGIVLSL